MWRSLVQEKQQGLCKRSQGREGRGAVRPPGQHYTSSCHSSWALQGSRRHQMCRQGLCPSSSELEHSAVNTEVLLPCQSSPLQQPHAGPRSTLDVVLAPPLPPWSRSGTVALLKDGFRSGSSFNSAPVFPPALSVWDAAGSSGKAAAVPPSCWDAEKV